MSDQNVILGVAFRSGLEKVVVPFFGSGVPVEYELIRSLNTVSRPARKKLGILRTDAQLTGGFSPTTFQQSPKQAIVTELAKQYEIIDIDASSVITPGQCDVLLAVQPSSLFAGTDGQLYRRRQVGNSYSHLRRSSTGHLRVYWNG